MPSLIVYEHDVINAVQPEVLGDKSGTVHSIFVDANLNQYTTTSSGPELGFDQSCCDVDGLTLWQLAPSEIDQLFIDAGASGALEPDGFNNSSVWCNEARDKLIFVTIGNFSGTRYLYVGVAPIPATGAVGPPSLTNYLRMQLVGPNLYGVEGVWERRIGSDPSSLILMTSDFTTSKVQWHVCPPVEDIEAGTYKGSHLGCTGVLATDQGPGLSYRWTHDTAFRVAFWATVHDGTVADSPIGFMADNKFYFVVPKGWMEGDNGFATNWGLDAPEGETPRPNGGAFRVDLPDLEYATYAWADDAVRDRLDIEDDAVDVTEELFSPPSANLPWLEEYTGIYDGRDNEGFLASYCGRPAIVYSAGLPVLLFGIIDGNDTYEDDVGLGERIFYAKVRGYKWTGSAFAQFDTAQGIVLRQGDLAFSDYWFDRPDSQHIHLIDGDIYFQICQWTGMGGFDDSRSVLTRFGRFVETETRTGAGSGRVRYVPRR